MELFPNWAVFVAFLMSAVVLAITPGPDMTLFLSKTMLQGRKAGFAAMFGAVTGLLVHTLLAALGLTALLAASTTGFTIVKIGGALYLLWLAISTLRNGSSLRIERGGVPSEKLTKLYFTGVGINLLNPKIIVFFLTFLPQFVSANSQNAMVNFMALGLLFIAISLPIVVGLILAADRVSDLLRQSPRITRAVDWLFASVFAGFAVLILFERERS